jgi:hypothetical protein
MSTPVPASTSIPFSYRLILSTLEPLFALSGVYSILFDPAFYNTMLTRNTIPYDPRSDFLYSAMAGGWLVIVFIEVVMLRAFDDVRLWKYLCASILLSDGLYAVSAAQAVGGWASWANVTEWSVNDVTVFLVTAVPILVRLLVIFGVGVKQVTAGKKTT